MLRHGLVRPFDQIEDAVAGMAGAHAQMMSAAELSIGIRTAGTTTADVRESLAPGGPVVKTYGPRGTIHLLPRRDLPLWCAALSAAPAAGSQPEGSRLTVSQEDAVIAAIATVLDSPAARNSPPDGDELDAAVVALTGPWAADLVMPAFGGMWPRWRQAIGTAAHRGVLAFGPNRGTRVTYVSPGIQVEVDPDDAVGWLIARFLHSYGPATPREFARWMGVKPAWATNEFRKVESSLTSVTFDGRNAYVGVGDEEWPEDRAPGLRLVPHFDPYVIGSFPRELVFPGAAADRALARGQAGTHPVLLVDGVVGGVWHSRRLQKRLDITIEPVGRLGAAQRRELESEADRIGAILGLDANVVLGTVTTRSHL